MKAVQEWLKKNAMLLLIIAGVLYLIVFPAVKSEGFDFSFEPQGGVGRKFIVEGVVMQDIMAFEPQMDGEWMRIKLDSFVFEYDSIIIGADDIDIIRLRDVVKKGQDIPVKCADEMLLLAKVGDRVRLVCKEGDNFFFDCKLNEFIFN